MPYRSTSRPRGHPALREMVRWLACFALAGAVQLSAYCYTYYTELLRGLTVASTARPLAIRVRLRTEGRARDTALRRALEARSRQPDELEPRPAEGESPTPQARPRPLPLRKPVQAAHKEMQQFLEDRRGLTPVPDVTPEGLLKVMAKQKPDRSAAMVKRLEQAARVTKCLPTESLREIGEYLGVQQAEYVPRHPPPPGPFEHRDAVPYDIEKAVGRDGKPTYRITMVDRAGRTFRFLVDRRHEDPSEYDLLYRIMQMGRSNPQFGLIVRRMFLPMAARLRRQAEAQEPAAAGRASPSSPAKP